MSDINDLIHSNARVAFQQGEKTERNRIVTMIQAQIDHCTESDCDLCLGQKDIIEILTEQIEEEHE